MDFETAGMASSVESGQSFDDAPQEEEIPPTQPDPVATVSAPSAEMAPPSEIPKRRKKPAASGASVAMLDDEAMGRDKGCGEFQFNDQLA